MRGVRAALALCAALVPAGGRAAAAPVDGALTWLPALGVPRVDGSGFVRWTPAPETLSTALARWRAGVPPDSADPAAALRAWRVLALDPRLGPFALRRVALCALDVGDSAAADSAWERLAAGGGLWAWEALRARTDLAVARRSPARADSLLEAADGAGWPDADRAAWLERRIALRATLGDTLQALEWARQGIRRYPALPAAARILAALDSLTAARRDTLSSDDRRAAAEVDFWRGATASAVRRLEDAAGGARDPWRVALRRGEVLRLAHRLDDARAALTAALRLAPAADDSARALLERARAARDAGRDADALADLGDAAARARAPGLRESAWWERARLLESRGRWEQAGLDYARVAETAAGRAGDATFRAGLMLLARGDAAGAERWLARAAGEEGRFWRAVLLRRSDPAAGDSALRVLAGLPGYTFYRAAARDSLGLRGWPGTPVARPPWDSTAALALARDLAAVGLSSEAATVLDRWAAGDARLGPALPDARRPRALLEAARLAGALGRMPLAIQLAGRCLAALGDSSAAAWSVVPWSYPAAFDSLFAAFPDSAAAGAAECALLQALAWQESKLDPRARSRSDALGLCQLKLATAAELARAAREPVPDRDALLDPALGLRYGARYLERQWRRFGSAVLALAAYNAGPGAIARWLALHAAESSRWPGGAALQCELIARPETEDYVKRILAVRQAYRELRPAAGAAAH
ncbi:MAG: transglycosylase SLT domain-containing protein [Candidatus Eisenbacteria bacterium]|nr:transglycosylase SLT domain-containing protein [Candidatus Eisenbacteria bacterium]